MWPAMLWLLVAGQVPQQTVHIHSYQFDPPTVQVTVGTEVVWVNDDDALHSVQEMHRLFASRPLDTHQRYSFVFDRAGTYRYLCSFHSQMTGRVVVTK